MPSPPDPEALHALSLAYAAAVDSLDGEAFAELFTEDGELWVPDPRDAAAGGAPTVVRAGRDRLRRIPGALATYHVTHHALGAATYEVDGDTAVGEVTGVAHHLSAAGGPDPVAGVDTVWYLRYADRYVRHAGGWLLARRELHLRRVEERPLTRLGPGRR